mgnify:CR=1 FL=1
MSTITRTSEQLLYLMACALQGVSAREEVLADADLKLLLIMARKHSVASMVCMALEKTAIFAGADDAVKKHWREAKNKAIRKNIRLGAHTPSNKASARLFWSLYSFCCSSVFFPMAVDFSDNALQFLYPRFLLLGISVIFRLCLFRPALFLRQNQKCGLNIAVFQHPR